MKNYQDLKTFEGACKVEGLDPKKVIPDFSCYPEKDRKSMIAHAKLVIIVRAANRLANDGKEWMPDFSNYNETKYEAWFDLEEGSSGFRCADCVLWATYSFVGSRLCFISRQVCEYVANEFIELYKEYFL
ncbi:hypothetical protein [Aquimarina algiphila]|uniref:hypothetical protein n=1 Tax=Aquimarina algiphila TaxID=2047982 RepID=UPI00249391D6|nr:hypothetical protein [Aquimarina algiphila]